ncbi:MAG TPA: STAS domain-containing protein [Planctomycetota bacterium]|jgi:anti-sigma B factor antagonist
MAGFRIQKEKLTGGVVLVGVKGFLDAHTFEQLEKEFADIFDAGSFRLIVDLAGLDYISSAGAGVFIEAIGTAQENEGNIVLMRPGPNVKEVFDLLGLSQIFTFKDTREEALQSLARVGA